MLLIIFTKIGIVFWVRNMGVERCIIFEKILYKNPSF